MAPGQRDRQEQSRSALRASARLDIALERGCFMSEVSAADTNARLRELGHIKEKPPRPEGKPKSKPNPARSEHGV